MIKKINILVIVAATTLFTGCTAKAPTPIDSIELDTFDKKLSYLFAFDSASSVKDVGVEFDVDVIRQAVEDVNNGAEPRLTVQEAQNVTRQYRLMQIESN